MAGNLTVALIKPHILFARKRGQIITKIEEAGFGIILSKMVHLRKEGAEVFYKEHLGRGFFPDLQKTMCAGPLEAMVLAKANAVEEWRNLIGATNSAEAAAGTIRHEFGEHGNMPLNAVHGSASDHDAKREINFFFSREIRLAEELNEIGD